MSQESNQFPPYAFVPGRGWPHPRSDPSGHSYGSPCELTGALDEKTWDQCPQYLRGFALFDEGYYWEAHEVWESLWLAQGRRGRIADVLKALIKLSAAGVKVRQGQPHGVVTHCHRASELLTLALREDSSYFLGLDLFSLRQFADEIARNPPSDPADMSATVSRVFHHRLTPLAARR